MIMRSGRRRVGLLGLAGLVVVTTGMALPATAMQAVPVPGAWSVVDLGRDVPLTGCGTTRVIATFPGGSVAGPVTRGCRGTARVPSRQALTAAGWQDGSALDLYLDADGSRIPLRYKHFQPDLGRVLAGRPTVVPALGDPQGDVSSLAMQAGDAVDLGPVDLTGVYAVLVRAAGYLSFELRAGKATGPVLASGTAGHARSDWAAKPRGTGEVYLSATAPLTRRPAAVSRLVLVVTQGAGLVNYVDLTGSGGMAPYRWPSALPRAVPLFDGRSIKGWKQIGPGRFSVAPDRSLLATGPSSEWGWLYNPRFRFTNFVLRLDVKEQSFGANGGILVRHSDNANNYYTSFTADEIQVTDVNTEYMGGVDHVATALRQPQSSPGEWSRMEIVANGPHLLVRVNGVVTADHDQTTGCNLPSVPCSGGAYGGYGTGGSGFIGFEAELQKVWYRDIVLHDCGVTDVVRQTSSDPLCNPAT
jgi:hypothetical protein